MKSTDKSTNTIDTIIIYIACLNPPTSLVLASLDEVVGVYDQKVPTSRSWHVIFTPTKRVPYIRPGCSFPFSASCRAVSKIPSCDQVLRLVILHIRLTTGVVRTFCSTWNHVANIFVDISEIQAVTTWKIKPFFKHQKDGNLFDLFSFFRSELRLNCHIIICFKRILHLNLLVKQSLVNGLGFLIEVKVKSIKIWMATGFGHPKLQPQILKRLDTKQTGCRVDV